MTRRNLSVQFIGMLAAVASATNCGREDVTLPPEEGDFSLLFHLESLVELEEPAPPLGGIGSIARADDGGYYVLDPITRRVLLFDNGGMPVQAAGQEGRGPGEFVSPWGMTIDDDGQILVSDPGNRRITVYDARLNMSRVVGIAAAWISYFEGQLVADMGGLGGGGRFSITSLDGGASRSFLGPSLESTRNNYWPRLARPVAAVGEAEIVAGFNLGFPLIVFDVDGDSIGTIGQEPPTFRPIEIASDDGSIGRFTPDELDDFFRSFHIISGAAVVEDRWLVIAIGNYERDPSLFVRERDVFVDVYDMDTGERVAHEVMLPVGAEMLAGGNTLTVLLSYPPDPWQIAEFAIRVP